MFIKIEKGFRDWRSRWFIIRIMILVRKIHIYNIYISMIYYNNIYLYFLTYRFQIWMFQSIFNGNSLCRIKSQQFFQHIKSQWIRMREHMSERNTLLKRKRSNIVSSLKEYIMN